MRGGVDMIDLTKYKNGEAGTTGYGEGYGTPAEPSLIPTIKYDPQFNTPDGDWTYASFFGEDVPEDDAGDGNFIIAYTKYLARFRAVAIANVVKDYVKRIASLSIMSAAPPENDGIYYYELCGGSCAIVNTSAEVFQELWPILEDRHYRGIFLDPSGRRIRLNLDEFLDRTPDDSAKNAKDSANSPSELPPSTL